ncbi:MAG TPA: crosslink repair DNA glycosylase YcaQ family protein [Actinomycetota bacterium]|nr:crosslink repair DNA glycosylase YcaQ family protein [Actinomycetota bacterium]
MPGPKASRLGLPRAQVLAFRRHVGALDERLPRGRRSLRRVAWAGLQDSMPRAALLSIHARVHGTGPFTWEDPSLVQLWGPRYSTYVVAARDLAIFSLGRLPDDAAGRTRAEVAAARLRALLGEARMTYGEAGTALGVPPNSLRYGATTGTVLMRWDGARQPDIWSVPPPEIDPGPARLELARRYLHVFCPATPEAFADWAGIAKRGGIRAFDALRRSLTPVRTPVGEAWILTHDERTFREPPRPPAAARLLPSGDAYFLLQGADRELLVPDVDRRRALWDPSGVARRGPRRGGDRRDVATRTGDRRGRDMGPPLPRGAERRRVGGGVDATPGRRGRDRRPLGRLSRRPPGTGPPRCPSEMRCSALGSAGPSADRRRAVLGR